MSYSALAVLAVAVVVLVDLVVLRTKLVGRKVFWTSYVIVLAGQLVVNGVLTGVPVVRYNPHAIVGWRFVYAPVEDLLFGFAMALLTLANWVWLGRRIDARRAAAPSASATR
jgi:lycopene cyclase domain-containing protein